LPPDRQLKGTQPGLLVIQAMRAWRGISVLFSMLAMRVLGCREQEDG